jgi:hypothetical protein
VQVVREAFLKVKAKPSDGASFSFFSRPDDLLKVFHLRSAEEEGQVTATFSSLVSLD